MKKKTQNLQNSMQWMGISFDDDDDDGRNTEE